jgi:hypothetical protein
MLNTLLIVFIVLPIAIWIILVVLGLFLEWWDSRSSKDPATGISDAIKYISANPPRNANPHDDLR